MESGTSVRGELGDAGVSREQSVSKKNGRCAAQAQLSSVADSFAHDVVRTWERGNPRRRQEDHDGRRCCCQSVGEGQLRGCFLGEDKGQNTPLARRRRKTDGRTDGQPQRRDGDEPRQNDFGYWGLTRQSKADIQTNRQVQTAEASRIGDRRYFFLPAAQGSLTLLTPCHYEWIPLMPCPEVSPLSPSPWRLEFGTARLQRV